MNIFNKIKSAIAIRRHITKTCKDLHEDLLYDIRAERMIDHAINDTVSGISLDKLCNNEIVVSLTTYGSRLYEVATTIESIMQGSVKPNHIVLWLQDDLKDTTLPVLLQNQQKRGLEIYYCKDIRSYKKLIPALKMYPHASIITIDDDVIYNYDLVENLIREHIKYPHHVIGNRIHRVVLGDNNKPLSYLKWKFRVYPTDDSSLNFSVGVGGILYPPGCFTDEVFNEDVFMSICGSADDVWFYAMELLAGTKVRKGNTHDRHGDDFVFNLKLQEGGLYQSNANTDTLECRNDGQISAVLEKYHLFDKLSQ